mgnify:CR=1 FL=1
MRIARWVSCSLLLLLVGTLTAGAADKWGLEKASVELQSAGPLAFGPDGILLVGDPKAATVFGIATGDTEGTPSKVELHVEALNEQAAKVIGAGSVQIVDLAVNPASGNIYLSVTADEKPALLKLDGRGNISAVTLKDVPSFSSVLPDAPENPVVGQGRRAGNRRMESITDLAFVDGKVIVSGLTSAENPSAVRELVFPFKKADKGTNVVIFHGAHGREENNSTVRVFVPFTVGGEPSLLAGFTCTPLVKFPLAGLAPGEHLKGQTVAELRNRIRPLDMIVYEQGGATFLLIANSARGVMKVSTANIESQKPITEPVGGGTAGLEYETIEGLQGVVQLDKLNDTHAVVLVQTESGAQNLKTVALP